MAVGKGIYTVQSKHIEVVEQSGNVKIWDITQNWRLQ